MTASVVMIDLNGINPSLVERWCDDGRLPTLARLRREGLSTPLRSRARLFPFSVASEVNTGRSVFKTGLFVQSNQLHGAHGDRLEAFAQLAPRQYWNVAGETGARVAAIDPLLGVPTTVPGRRDRTNGVELLGWSLHDRTPFGATSRPADLLPSVRRDYGAARLDFDDPLHQCNAVPRDDLARVLRASVEQKGRLLLDLLRREDFDFVSGTFSEAHCGGHQLWHAPDSLLAVYEALDEHLGRIIDAAGPGAAILAVGTDAIGPPFGNGPAFLPHVLERLASATQTGWRLAARSRLSGRLGHTLRRLVPRSVKRALVPERSRAAPVFTVFNGFTGALRLNLAGREPSGVVQPGNEATALVDEITRTLLGLRLCGTEAPVVEAVLDASGTYGGAFHPGLPDVIVVFRKDLGDYACVESPQVGRIQVNRVRSAHVTGENRGVCQLWSIGPDRFEPGGAPPDVLDIAPTVLALLGQDVPPWIDGRPLFAKRSKSGDR